MNIITKILTNKNKHDMNIFKVTFAKKNIYMITRKKPFRGELIVVKLRFPDLNRKISLTIQNLRWESLIKLFNLSICTDFNFHPELSLLRFLKKRQTLPWNIAY